MMVVFMMSVMVIVFNIIIKMFMEGFSLLLCVDLLERVLLRRFVFLCILFIFNILGEI